MDFLSTSTVLPGQPGRVVTSYCGTITTPSGASQLPANKPILNASVWKAFKLVYQWELILRRRPTLREVFADFDPARVAEFTDADVENILARPGMIRNERKIRAVITNARACVALRDDPDFPGGLEEVVRSFAPAKTECYGHSNDVPTKSEESAALAKMLKRKGFSFVGPTTMFALLEAIGLVKYDISPGTPVESAQAQN